MPRKAENLTGQTFGYLTVMHRVENQNRKVQYLCRCACGRLCVRSAQYLRRPDQQTKSCGCRRWETSSSTHKTHGMSHSRIFHIWRGIIDRCLYPNCKDWKNYGGRGIKICKRWRDSFENFLEDMGPTYKPDLQIDRIDNNQGYSPENCHWVTPKENARNRRTNYIVPGYGKTLAELSEISGVGAATIKRRIQYHWPTELLLIPPRSKKKYTTSKIVDLNTVSQYTTPKTKPSG